MSTKRESERTSARASSTKTFGSACTLPKNFNFCITGKGLRKGLGKEARHMKTLPYKVTLNNTPKLRPAAKWRRARERERDAGREKAPEERQGAGTGSSYAA